MIYTSKTPKAFRRPKLVRLPYEKLRDLDKVEVKNVDLPLTLHQFAQRTRSDARTAGPGRAGPGRAGPVRAGPGRAGPGRAGPGRAGPGRAGPGRAGPTKCPHKCGHFTGLVSSWGI